MSPSPSPGPAALLRVARGGDRRAVARLITLVERGGDTALEIAGLLPAADDAGHVIGITGAPGAGKSSLTGRLLACLADAGRTPAVLAVDPSSPLTGGAILGDRVRMDGFAAGAFVRSMATRGQQGGLAFAVPATTRLLAHLGFDPVIVETTGVGQVEVDIASAADTTVLVTSPGWGDAVQANKAGLLELADVLVVNKADRPGARDARRDLELMLDLGHISGLEARAGRRPEIVLTVATTGDGVPELLAAADAHRASLAAGDGLVARRRRGRRLELAATLERSLRALVDTAMDTPAGRRVLADVEAGTMSPADACAVLLAGMGPQPPRGA